MHSRSCSTGSTGMRSYLHTVTPEQAEKWLAINSPNRPLKNTTIDAYAADMIAGRWELNGSTIVFGKDGRLIDGQHRLIACKRSGCSFASIIVEGVEAGVELTIDGGTKRNYSDHLSFRGEQNTAVLSAIARTAFCYDFRKNRHAGIRVPVRDIVEYIERNPAIRDTAAKVASLRTKKGSSPTLVGPGTVHFLASARLGQQKLADQFLEGIATGALLGEGDPRLAYRNRMLSREHITPTHRFWAACQTWNAWTSGQQKDRLYMPNEPVAVIAPEMPRMAAE